jgi:hypothetical protein
VHNWIQCCIHNPENDTSRIWKPRDQESPSNDAEAFKDSSTVDPEDLKDLPLLETDCNSDLKDDDSWEPLPAHTLLLPSQSLQIQKFLGLCLVTRMFLCP